MKNIIIPFENDKYISWLIELLKEKKMPFQVVQDTELDSETVDVRNQLDKKYGKIGIWKDMSKEEQEDAVLGETMIYRQEQSDYIVLNEPETEAFLKALENGTL